MSEPTTKAERDELLKRRGKHTDRLLYGPQTMMGRLARDVERLEAEVERRRETLERQRPILRQAQPRPYEDG